MGFGGSTAAMITSLKNNNRRNKREAFEGWTGFDKESQGIKIEPISEELLQEIRDTLQRQRQVLFRKRLIGFGLMIILIVGLITII